jgi:hypothetical protein
LVTLSGVQGAQTLQTSDNLTGTGTNATLNAVLTGALGPITPNLKGIETLNLTALGTQTVNLSNSTGGKAIEPDHAN